MRSVILAAIVVGVVRGGKVRKEEEEECGVSVGFPNHRRPRRSSARTGRIVGGESVAADAWPWAVRERKGVYCCAEIAPLSLFLLPNLPPH